MSENIGTYVNQTSDLQPKHQPKEWTKRTVLHPLQVLFYSIGIGTCLIVVAFIFHMEYVMYKVAGDLQQLGNTITGIMSGFGN